MAAKYLKAKNGKEVLDFAKAHGAKLVDFKFCDIPGTWQHFTTTLGEIEESTFKEGLGFDGSSIRGWKSINSDRKSTRLNSSHVSESRMPSSA